ncbi:hypothetical protein MtrunA17_Chr1g0178321 [Medicago truncatula]|uniref:Uncharacterized protein n=1 Tax=Medicago truncatula TaxID=3880 RepID=A0A396JXY6_MEDTR|nr:hypothetical protein MtrunA17_Chr1g0178321 [Medicago truncatula]
MLLLFFSDWRMVAGGVPARWPASNRGCSAAPELKVLLFLFFFRFLFYSSFYAYF